MYIIKHLSNKIFILLVSTMIAIVLSRETIGFPFSYFFLFLNCTQEMQSKVAKPKANIFKNKRVFIKSFNTFNLITLPFYIN